MLNKLDITYLYFIPFMLSAIFSLKSFRLKWPKHLRTFSMFLVFTFSLEMLGNFWKWELFHWFHLPDENIWILNIGMIGGRAILFLYFSQLLPSVRLKQVIKILLPTYLIFSLANYFLIQKPIIVNSYSVGLGSLIIIFFCILYFIEILNIKETVQFYKFPEFWIAAGTFIYYLFSLPLISGFDFLARNEAAKKFTDILWQFNDGFLIFTYTLYLIAYLCPPHPKSQYRLSSSPH